MRQRSRRGVNLVAMRFILSHTSTSSAGSDPFRGANMGRLRHAPMSNSALISPTQLFFTGPSCNEGSIIDEAAYADAKVVI